MNWISRLKRGLLCLTSLAAVIGIGLLAVPVTVQAQGGVAFSGSFYQQDFVIPQGAAASGPDIYVVVFNNGTDQLKLRMTYQAPSGVTLNLSNQDFVLSPGGQQKILVGVSVGNDTPPGDYELHLTAESYRNSADGIQLAGAAGQSARLTVTGESARIMVRALSSDGQQVIAMVRLFRIIQGQNREVGYSETGTLDTKVVPGDFTAVSFMGGQEVARQNFSLAANDNKTVNLSGATVYFEGFGLVPNHITDSGKLAFLQMTYTVKNLYQKVNKGEVLLQVNINGNPQAPVTLAALSPLETGSVGLNYTYIPSGGWQEGEYAFQLQLNLEGSLYTSSAVEHYTVGASPADSASSRSAGISGGLSPFVIGAILAAAVILAGLLIFRFRRK